MNTRIEATSLPAGTQIKIGPTADKPHEAIEAAEFHRENATP